MKVLEVSNKFPAVGGASSLELSSDSATLPADGILQSVGAERSVRFDSPLLGMPQLFNLQEGK